MFIIFFWVFVNIFFYKIISDSGFSVFLLLNLFLGVNSLILFRFLKNLRRNIIYVYTYTGWILYTTLGIVRECFVGNKDYNGAFSHIIFLFIIASLLIYLGIYLMQRVKFKKGFAFLNEFRLSSKTFLVLIAIDLALTVYKIVIAGGLHSFIYAGYGNKVESSFMTFFSLFPGITTNVLYLCLPFIFYKTPLHLRIIAGLYFVINIVMGVLNGSSLSIFNPLLALFSFIFLSINQRDYIRLNKVKVYALVFVCLAIIGGVLIRQNRTNYGEFSRNVDIGVVNNILQSSTFDNISNLEDILKMEPTYSLGQTIYPFVSYLPRKVFPWKPMELSRIISYKIKGMDEENLIGFLPSPIGEFYYDFGYIGIILGMLYVGFIIGFVQEKMNNTKNSVWKLAITLGFCIYATIISGWYTGFAIRGVRLVLFLVLVFYINKFFLKNKKILS